MNSKELENLSLEKLGSLFNSGNMGQDLLVADELKRRDRMEQHKLDLTLIGKQVKWMKFSVCAILIAAIISGAVGYFLATIQNPQIDNQLKFLHKLIQENISHKNNMALHKETIE